MLERRCTPVFKRRGAVIESNSDDTPLLFIDALSALRASERSDSLVIRRGGSAHLVPRDAQQLPHLGERECFSVRGKVCCQLSVGSEHTSKLELGRVLFLRLGLADNLMVALSDDGQGHGEDNGEEGEVIVNYCNLRCTRAASSCTRTHRSTPPVLLDWSRLCELRLCRFRVLHDGLSGGREEIELRNCLKATISSVWLI